MSACPSWCQSAHSRAPVDPEGVVVHSTTPVTVDGISAAIKAAEDDLPEVHVFGEADLAPDDARELARVISVVAYRLAGISGA